MSATLDALVAENRDLRRELNNAETRLRSIESSRWWRLHPRYLLRAGHGRNRPLPVAPTRAEAPPAAPQAPVQPAPVGDDPSLAAFREEIFARGAFTEDWVTTRFSRWRAILEDLEGATARILEIGSFEGLSACFLLWRLPLASLTCVDTFAGIPEHAGMRRGGIESVFDANVALVDASRVTKLVGDSKRRLLDLSAEDARFDLVYVDGSHFALDVLVDAALSWDLLAPHGVIVFDDYRWAYVGEDPLLRPGKAIDAFLEVVEGKHEVLFADEQIALRRIT